MGLESVIRKNLIPGPGSRGQKSTGSRIPDPDTQHCPNIGKYDMKYYQGAASGVSLQRRQCAWRWGRCRCCSGSCSRGRWGGPASGCPAHLHTHTTEWLHQSCRPLEVTFRIIRLRSRPQTMGTSKILSLLIPSWNNFLFQCPFVAIWALIKTFQDLVFFILLTKIAIKSPKSRSEILEGVKTNNHKTNEISSKSL